jgi:hypothetical protein
MAPRATRHAQLPRLVLRRVARRHGLVPRWHSRRASEDIDFLACFPDETDPSSSFKLESIVLYHPPTEKDGHISAIVHHNGWKHVSDKEVTTAGQDIAAHKEYHRLHPRVATRRRTPGQTLSRGQRRDGRCSLEAHR